MTTVKHLNKLMLTPIKQYWIPVPSLATSNFFRTGFRVNVWDLVPQKMVYEIIKPREVCPFTFVVRGEDPAPLFTQMYHSGVFESEMSEAFTRMLHKTLLGTEYDVVKVSSEDYDLDDDDFTCYRCPAVDVMARLFFIDAVEGGLIFGDNITSYERIDR